MVANPHSDLDHRLWAAADELRANSGLTSSEYSVPVLGLVFLRYADRRFAIAHAELTATGPTSSRRTLSKTTYQARGVLYLPEEARFSYLQSLPEGADLGKAINLAMELIEKENDDLDGVLPQTYTRFTNASLVELLKLLGPIDMEGDAFGRIYEYFLGEFARSQGQLGGEFFTPLAIVRLIVEIIQPFHGRILDPACGSGGMFVPSAARIVGRHQRSIGANLATFGTLNASSE